MSLVSPWRILGAFVVWSQSDPKCILDMLGNNHSCLGSRFNLDTVFFVSRTMPPKQKKQKCLASKCEELRQDKHRWCLNHKRQADSIAYQASKANKQTECKEIMEEESSAQAAMEEFDNLSPLGQKFGKKKSIDWAQWSRKFASKKKRRSVGRPIGGG